MTPTAVVFGGAGFIGRHLTQRLLNEGVEVWVVDSLLTGTRLEAQPNLHFLQQDILDLPGLKTSLPHHVDWVYHLAFPTGKCSRERNTQFLDVVTEGMLNVLDYCLWAEAKLMYGSSISVYGLAQTQPIHETHPLAPILLYGANKCLAEQYIGVYVQTKGLEAAILRISDVFGPYDLRANAVNLFISASLEGRPIEIRGDGQQIRTFSFVEDIAEGLARARHIQSEERIFNLGGCQSLRVLELAKQIMDATKKHVPFIFKPEGQDMRNYIIDSTRFRMAVGEFEGVGIGRGLEKTVLFRLGL
jgi:nucleoside-diphosphate-sugar epimerase